MIDPTLTKVAVFATWHHRKQKRKYTGDPYINHCKAVADIVASVPHTNEMIYAAWLHDVVEDTDATLEEVKQEFGLIVANYVYGLTDKSQLSDGNREIRKKIDREHLKNACVQIKTIKLADLIDNTRSIVQHDRGFAKVYLYEKSLLLPLLNGGDPTLWYEAYSIYLEGVQTSAGMAR